MKLSAALAVGNKTHCSGPGRVGHETRPQRRIANIMKRRRLDHRNSGLSGIRRHFELFELQSSVCSSPRRQVVLDSGFVCSRAIGLSPWARQAADGIGMLTAMTNKGREMPIHLIITTHFTISSTSLNHYLQTLHHLQHLQWFASPPSSWLPPWPPWCRSLASLAVSSEPSAAARCLKQLSSMGLDEVARVCGSNLEATGCNKDITDSSAKETPTGLLGNVVGKDGLRIFDQCSPLSVAARKSHFSSRASCL